ncbi:SGCA protein, partial [Dicrurus megarhynchus]|nr:SGCA protein [Dicrurus megarhynchus]
PAAPVTFRAHLWDRPDLPRWLRFAQRDPGQPGFLYGCPLAPELGTHSVQVLAYNRHTFATASQRLLISVTPAPGGDAPFQAEFLVGDRNVEELLPEAAREVFLQGSAGVWERGDLHIVNITSALDRGGRVPLPIEGRREGVYVQVGSHSPFSPCLASAVSPQSRSRCHRGQRPLASCYDTFAPHFSIHWCNLTLGPPQPPPALPTPRRPPKPPSDTGWGTRSCFTSLTASEGPNSTHQRDTNPNKGVLGVRPPFSRSIQLVHHSSIHGDTRELRSMAGSRDVPRPLSTLPMFNVRTGQRINPMPGPRDGARVPLL